MPTPSSRPARSFRLSFLPLACFMALATIDGLAQDRTADSLRAIWHDASRPDSIRYQAMYGHVRGFFHGGSTDSLVYIGGQLLDFARSKGLRKQEGMAANIVATGFGKKGESDSSMHYLEQAAAIFRSLHDDGNLSKVLNNLGNVASSQGDLIGAIEYLTQSLHIAESVGDSSAMARALGNIGTLYHMQGDRANAMEYYQRRVVIAEAIGDMQCASEAYGNMAIVHEERGDTAQAIAEHERSVKVGRELADSITVAIGLFNIGRLLSGAGNHEAAMARFNEGMAMAQGVGSSWAIANGHVALGDALLRHGEPGKAMTSGRMALALARDISDLELLRDATGLLYKVYKALGNAGEALAMHEEHVMLRDSMLRDENKQAIMHQRFKYEYEKKEALLQAEQEKKDVLLAEERQRRRNALIGIALVAVIAVLLAWLLFSTRRKNAAIVAAHQRVVEAEKQRENEQVRTRIARDIHDEIGAGLTKIALLSDEARLAVQAHSEKINATLDRINIHSREVSAALNDIVWSVEPAHDTSFELVSHARSVARRLLEGSGTAHDLRFHHNDPEHAVAPGVKHHIVMVMKEAINNALKYAEAKHITVELEAGAHAFRLLVRDDGKGFDPEAMARAGNGLRNMKARAEGIGAVLTVESNPGHGTSIGLQGPLD